MCDCEACLPKLRQHRTCVAAHREGHITLLMCSGKEFFLNSVSGLVSMIWYRIPFDQSELSISKIPPTGSLTVRPRRDR